MSTSVEAPMFKNFRSTFERLEKFISEHHFTDCNLFGQIYSSSIPFERTLHADFGQERPGFHEAETALSRGRDPVPIGFTFGPTWSTHWFKICGTLPESWLGKRVHLRWNSDCEAMIWDTDGRPLQGLSGGCCTRTDFLISDDLSRSELVAEFFIECAGNDVFGAGNNGMIEPPNLDRKFTLKTAEFAIFNQNVYQVLLDLEILIGMAKNIAEKSHRRFQALHAGNQIVQLLVEDRSDEQLKRAHDFATDFFSQRNGDSQFTIYATANSHIDTAWLWPYAETRRKVARSWSNALRIFEKYPEMVFAVSQAVQIEWLREDYPALYAEICEKARSGGFVGVGGAWVEMDGLLPSGESFVRQMLYGQKEFLSTFGEYCNIFWLPDTFGYSGQLPQIMSQAGMNRFVTQKISWNFVNKFPHHSFHWIGIDGTSVLTHFSPTPYNAEMTVEEVMKTSENFEDKGRSTAALMLYGYGDGGGGPDTKMLERIRRLANVDGVPKVTSASPAAFFDHVEKERDALCTWNGELYLELHNGTYTSQAETKRSNRECEFLLRDCEFLSVVLGTQAKQEIRSWESEWKKVLLNQFHDVLPGSSIEQVYKDAGALYGKVTESCNAFLSGTSGNKCLVNTLSWPRLVHSEGKLYKLPPMSVSDVQTVEFVSRDTVQVREQENGLIFMENRYLKVALDSYGRVVALKMKNCDGLAENSRDIYDAVAPGQLCNEFTIYDDVPLYWDAWDVMDYHLETRQPQNTLESPLRIVDQTNLNSGKAEFELKIGKNSRLKQEIILRSEQPYVEFRTEVDWCESHKLLKAEFPLNVHAQNATYEIQFGHVARPTHRNTSWDAAKYEVCAHKWADLSEHGFGVALLNDSKYGHSCYGNKMCLSLLRSPKAPDANCDMGHHRFSYALMPHLGPFQMPLNCEQSVIHAAYEFNVPPRVVNFDPKFSGQAVFSVDNPGVIIESVKGAENGKGLILRLYEAHGGKARAAVAVAQWIGVSDVKRVDLLERDIEDFGKTVTLRQNNVIELMLRPFEILSVLVLC